VKIETFCKRTGWPLDEFMNLGIFTVAEILALYGMEVRIVIRHRRRTVTIPIPAPRGKP
jgi:hypothetical protein